MSEIHQQALASIYRQVLQRLVTAHGEAQRQAMLRLAEWLGRRFPQLEQARLVVMCSGDRDGLLTMALLRGAQLLRGLLLFYVVCALAISLEHVDQSQVNLAWLFVAARSIHALIYISWNHVPYRFTAWMAGCITLAVLWFRFGAQAWPV